MQQNITKTANVPAPNVRRPFSSDNTAAPSVAATSPKPATLWYAGLAFDDAPLGEKAIEFAAGFILQEFADLRYELDELDHKRRLGPVCFTDAELERASFDALQTREAIDALRPLYLALHYGQTSAWWNRNRELLLPYLERFNREQGVALNLDDLTSSLAIYRN